MRRIWNPLVLNRPPGRWRVIFTLGLLTMAGLLAVTGGSVAGALSGTTPLMVNGEAIETIVTGGDGATITVVGASAIHRSYDGGTTWVAAGPSPPPGQIVEAVDDWSVLLAGDHPPCARGGEPDILHRSVDGGATWRATSGGEGVRPLAVWTAAGVALGSACDGITISTDGGATWQSTALPDIAGYDVTSFAVLPNEDAAGPSRGLLGVTSEGGTSQLREIDLSDPTAPSVGPVLNEYWGIGALVARADGTLALGTANGVFLSDDGGTTGELSRDGLEAVTLAEDPLVAGVPVDTPAGSFGIEVVVFDPATTSRIFAGTADGVAASTDGGATWSMLSGVTGRIEALALARESNQLLAQTEDGVFTMPIADASA